ncbi:hypothetical protein [Streptomyces sp. NPDC059970]|uniref:hypothetical protein n=1 Tax=Streptomyces sp. NPDC059970 TaxID=3347019 RepID=UPI0036CEC435
MNTATNHACRWLFPGHRAGQPLHPDVLAALLNDIGIPTTAGRTAAIRQHVLEMPAPVVAEALSYHRVTTAKLAPRPEAPGADTPLATTGGRHQAGPHGAPPEPAGRLNLLLRRKGTQRNLHQLPTGEGQQSLASDLLKPVEVLRQHVEQEVLDFPIGPLDQDEAAITELGRTLKKDRSQRTRRIVRQVLIKPSRLTPPCRG